MLFFSLKAQHQNIQFVENKGQWDSRVLYKANVPGGSFFIRKAGITVVQHNPEDLLKRQEAFHNHSSSRESKQTAGLTIHSHSWNIDFEEASAQMEVVGDKALNTYENYFIGDDPTKWASNCRVFQAITLKNVYPNIDVRYYTNNGMLKYDMIVKPGADPSKISLKYEGVDGLSIKNKELIVATTVGERKESFPYTYQTGVEGRKAVNCKYRIKGNKVRFDLKEYDVQSTLIIDPSFIFSTFSGSTAENWGFTATYGPDGSFFGGGIVFSTGFPVSPGAYDESFQGGEFDIGIIKLNPNGSNRIYATYIGGDGDDQPHSLIVDAVGNLILAGRTNSSNYPTAGGEIIGPGGGYDIIVTKLNAAGSALIGSRKIGGTDNDGVNIKITRGTASSLEQHYGDDGRSEVNLDNANNIYVSSCTQSSDFPKTANAFQQISGGKQDGVVLKFNHNLTINLFSSYLGGSENDAAYVVSLAPNGDIFVGGGTESSNFPGSHSGTIGTATNGGIDGFVAIISNNGNNIIRSSFIGTNGIDQVYGLKFDRKGFPYITGQTTGNWQRLNIPATNTLAKGGQFICKLQPDLSAYVYSFDFGVSVGTPSISPTAFLVDRCENVYLSGWGAKVEKYPALSTRGLPVTPDANQPQSDDADFYFFVMKKDAAFQLYGTFYGQIGGAFPEHVDGGTSRFDDDGVIYQAICANCRGGAVFPTTFGSWSPTKPYEPSCNIAMVKIAMNLAGVGGRVQSAINGRIGDTSGCLPLTVNFSDLMRTAKTYIWNFGDGTPQQGPLPAATGRNIQHTFTSEGTFRVMMIAIDSASCNVSDTAYINISVSILKAETGFEAVKTGPCESNQYQFNNLSIAPATRPFTDTSFMWDFGDGSAKIIAGTQSVLHTYTNPGTYNVILTLVDSAYCNFEDGDTLRLTVTPLIKADFNVPNPFCVPTNLNFSNTSVGGQQWSWDFGDGSISTEFEPVHNYNIAGSYVVKLIAIDSNTCNIIDSITKVIRGVDAPTSNFSINPGPNVLVENKPHFFTNLSSADATSFKWIFGDGDTLRTTSRAVVEHQYNLPGEYEPCLVAFNPTGCTDTICSKALVAIKPLLDVPNAFTPNSRDINSIVMVKGFGIVKIHFTIWNRWGQKVFETTNRLAGWDGKVNGQVQPMDVYAYTLDAEFFDGKKATKKGDITLIR